MLALASFLVVALAGDAAFDEGTRLYAATEYEQAIFRFEELAVRPSLAPADKAEALVWLGLSYAGTGDFDAARRAFADAVRTDAAVSLPANVSPRVVDLFAEVKAANPTTTNPTTTNPTTTNPTNPTTDPTTPDPAKPTTPAPSLPWSAYAFAAGGAVSVGVGSVLAVMANDSFGDATDKQAFQDEAAAARDAMDLQIAGAAVLIPLGVVLVGISGGLLVAGGDPSPEAP